MHKGAYIVGNRKFMPIEKFMFCIIVFFLFAGSYYYLFFAGYNGLTWTDFGVQRTICVYTLRGIDIYAMRGADIEPEYGLTPIYMGFHAVPWGFLLGNIIYPAFLSFDNAKMYFLAVNALTLAVVSYVLFRKTRAVSVELGFSALIMSLLSVDFLASVFMGNGGFMISAFILIAWAVCRERPYIAGVLIGLAMIKPQVAAIVCLSMLLAGRVKPLVVGAVIDIAAWFVVSVLTKTGMFELLREFLFSSDKLTSSMMNAGLFTLLFSSQLVSVAAGMLLGIIFVLLLHICMPENFPEYFRIYPSALASAFWCYANLTDGYMLILPAIVCLWLMMNQQIALRRFMWFCSCMWCTYGVIIRSVLRRILHMLCRTLERESGFSVWIPRTVYEFGLIAIGIMICLRLLRTHKEAQ